MKKLANNTFIGILSFFFLLSLMAFHQGPEALATVKKNPKGGFIYSDINKKSINTKISNGYFRLTMVDFYQVDKKFYLVRHVKSAKGKVGFLFSEVKRVKDKLYAIEKPEFFWPCWQSVNCQCDRPGKYEDCRCSAGSGGCVSDWGGPGFEDLFEKIYN